MSESERFIYLSSRMLPFLSVITILVLSVGLFLVSCTPDDFQQGVTVRIMFIHVPLAWLSLLCYLFMVLFSVGILFRKNILFEVALKSAVTVGSVFTALVLVTGSLWGKPVWGTWWVWDARLTSMLILLFIYLGICALSRAFENKKTAARAAAIFCLVGFINIPIIKFSVNWWNTLHQPASVLTKKGTAMDSAFLIPLLVMTVAFLLVFLTMQTLAMRNEIFRQQLSKIQKQREK